MKIIQLNSIEEIHLAAGEILNLCETGRIFAFYGELGAGKTTIINAVCRLLGAEESLGSPSFSIINEYISRNGISIFHFDFYRINNHEEAFDIGIEEYFYGNGICFIEWPEKIEELLPENIVKVKIKVQKDESREITIEYSSILR